MKKDPSSFTPMVLSFKRRLDELGVPPEVFRREIFQHYVARGWIVVVWYKGKEGQMMLLNPDMHRMPKVKK